jgi:hypothetical protein
MPDEGFFLIGEDSVVGHTVEIVERLVVLADVIHAVIPVLPL